MAQKLFGNTPWEDQQWPYFIRQEDIDSAKTYIHELLWCRQLWTTDIDEVNKRDLHFVFVYGSLKKSGVNNKFLTKRAGYHFVGPAVTVSNKYVMYEETATTKIPFVLNHDLQLKHAHVFGELYIVPAQTLIEVDEFENNGGTYDRRRTGVKLLSPYENITIVAWMYHGSQTFWGNALDKTPEKYRLSKLYTNKKLDMKHWFYQT